MKLFIIILCFLNTSWAQTLVNLNQGQLNGLILNSRNGRNYSAFLGIPYGQPPINNLRFSNPRKAGEWKGTLNAVSFGNMCLQEINGTIAGSEDCLYLNVYKPMVEKSKLPVMVWIHGGYFIKGSSNEFSAEYLLDRDIILVTLNYRLGIFGFFTTSDSTSPGNFGLKDQVLALQWVKENIRAFGGDPEKVTLFGQSAGGASVSLHALSKASDGLFQKYIVQSGSSLSAWAYRERNKFKEPAKKVANITGCDFTTSEILVECLREKSVKELMNTTAAFDKITQIIKLMWLPTDEPKAKDAFLTDSPQHLIANNEIKDLPFISGIVSDEGLLVSKPLYFNEKMYTTVKSKLEKLLFYFVSQIGNFKNIKNVVNEVNKFYFSNSEPIKKNKFLKGVTEFLSDGGFIYPELRMLEQVTPKMKTSNYFYFFGYANSRENNGVPHGAEVPYLFPKKGVNINLNISKLMVDLWTSFAEEGKPTSNILTPPDLWEPFETENSTKHLQIGNINNYSDPRTTLSDSLYPKRMEFWKNQF